MLHNPKATELYTQPCGHLFTYSLLKTIYRYSISFYGNQSKLLYELLSENMIKLLELCRCNTACFTQACCGDNTCGLAGQVRHTCITPFATTPAGQATETCEFSGSHHTCRPLYGHLSIIQWPSHLQAKLKNTCVSSSGHQTCRPSYRHL